MGAFNHALVRSSLSPTLGEGFRMRRWCEQAKAMRS